MTEELNRKPITTAEALEKITAAVLHMDPEEKPRALKFLKWYGSGRIQIKNGSRREIRYDLDSQQATVYTLGDDDTEGLIAGFLGIEKRHWLDDLDSQQ